MVKSARSSISGVLRGALASAIALCGFTTVSVHLAATDVRAQDSQVSIVSVDLSGNRRIDSAALKTQLKSAPPVVTSSGVSEDIKALYKTGFFDQVTGSIVSTTSGPVLRFSLVEKPLVRKVFITGNKEIREDDLSSVLKLGTNRFLDKSRIAALIKTGASYYQAKGFYDASFDYSVTPVGDNQVDVTFKVNEGERYKIREISINGLKELDESDLLSEIQTRTYKWYNSWLFSTGRLNQDLLENDKAVMRQYFLDHGYIDASVGEARIVKEDDGLSVSFDVNEGRLYTIGTISASGELIEGSIAKTLDGIKTKTGEDFSAAQVREDTFAVSEKYTDIGFAFANVVPNTAVRRADAKVDLDFNVSRGNQITVNRINIRGNDKTYDHVIRRSLKIEEQQKYSSSKIKRSQQLLERLGYFEEVNIASEPTADPSKVDLNVNVREASTGSFSAGAGVSSSDGAIFSTKVSENNIGGTGQSVNLTGEFGTERDNLVLSYTNPRVDDSYLSFNAQALKTDRSFSDFDRKLAGGNVSVGYPLEEVFGESFEDINAGLKYEFLDINIDDVDPEDAAQLVIDSEGKSTVSAFSPSLVRNTINNPLNPTTGSKQVLSGEFAGFGGDEDYYLLEARNQWYKPMFDLGFGDFVFSLRSTVGFGHSNTEDPFPLFRRYFPGGINSIRGYKNRSLGPKDVDGNEYGGAKEMINNTEVIFPLVNSAGLKGVVFHDIGEAFDDDNSISFGGLRQAYGFGLRWNSPLGPIRIELGFPIAREPGERKTNTMFSFGAPF